MLLENETIRLRALEPEDLDILYVWENDTCLWPYGSSLSPYSKLTIRQYLIDAQQQDIYQLRQLRLMVELKSDEPKVAGAIDLYEYDLHNSRAGIGILIDEAHQGKGYGAQALELMIEYAFQFLDIHQLYAYIAVDNIKSHGLFQKLRFQQVGILKGWKRVKQEYKDVYLMQLIRNGKSERRVKKSQ